jgi:hypothetical protein
MRKKNLFLLLLILTSLRAQTARPLPWQEYNFKADGFAIAAPVSPHITDAQAPDIRIYRWTPSAAVVFVIHIGVVPDCLDNVTRIKNSAKNRPDGGSMKDISLAGVPGVEGESMQVSGGRKSFERLYCAGKKAYDLTATYPANQPRSPVIDRMFSSFRFLNSNSQ